MKIYFFLSLLILTLLSSQTEKGIVIKERIGNEGKRWAICVGINDYEERGILDLKKARNDALALSEIFRKYGQFDHIYTFTDENDAKGEFYPTLRKLKTKLNYLKDFVKPNDLVVFSFSGHGVSNNEGESYLVLADTDPNEMFKTSLKLKDVTDIFTQAGVKKSLLIVDACRESFQENKGINTMGLKSEKFEKSEVAATFYATKDGWYSYEDDSSDYGAFTKHIIDGLAGGADKTEYQGNADGIVTFNELASFVEDGVKEWALERSKKQIPYTKIWGEKYGDLALSSYSVNGYFSKKKEDKKIIKDVIGIETDFTISYINSDKILTKYSGAIKAKSLLSSYKEKNLKDSIEKNKEVMQPVIDKINTSIKEVAKYAKFDIVFDANTGTLLYAKPEYEITDNLIENLENGQISIVNKDKKISGNYLSTPLNFAYINSDKVLSEYKDAKKAKGNSQLMQTVIDNINIAIKEFSVSYNLNIVCDANTGTLLYAKPEYDITDLLIRKLNGENVTITYKAKKSMKFGYIDSDKVLAEFSDSKVAKEQLSDWNKAMEAKVVSMEKKIQTLEDEIKSMPPYISESKKNKKLKEGQDLLQEYYQFKDKIWGDKGDFYIKNNLLMQPVIDKINIQIKNTGERENFDFIVDANTGTLLYSELRFEITNIIIDELNK